MWHHQIEHGIPLQCQGLDISYTKVKELDVTPLTNLGELFISGTLIKLLDLRTQKSLKTVHSNYRQKIKTSGEVSIIIEAYYSSDGDTLDTSEYFLKEMCVVSKGSSGCQKMDERNLGACKVLCIQYTGLSRLQTNLLGNLTMLCIAETGISELDTKPLVNLIELQASYSRLTILDTESLGKLKELYICRTNIEQLKVAGLTSLEILSVGWSRIKSLDLTGLSHLKEIHCSPYQKFTVNDGVAMLERPLGVNSRNINRIVDGSLLYEKAKIDSNSFYRATRIGWRDLQTCYALILS